MHMINKKDLNSAEMRHREVRRRFSQPPSEVQTHEEATVCQKIRNTLDYESLRGYASNFIAFLQVCFLQHP